MSATTRTPPARVSALRTLSLVLAFAAALGLIFGTAGFTAMEADRGLTANVTDDEHAYLSYEPVVETDAEVHDGESTPVVEYQNQFGVDLTEFRVDVSADDSDVTVAAVDAPETLPKGNEGEVAVTLHCDAETTVPLAFAVNGSGGGVSVSFERTHTVTCVAGTDGSSEPTVTGVTFNDGANADVETGRFDGNNGTDSKADNASRNANSANSNARSRTDRSGGEVAAIAWLAPNPPSEDAAALTAVRFDGDRKLDASKKVRPQLNGHPAERSDDWKIAAIEFPGQGVTYVHPGWEAGRHASPGSGDGVEYAGLVDEEFLLDASVEGGEVVTDGSGDE